MRRIRLILFFLLGVNIFFLTGCNKEDSTTFGDLEFMRFAAVNSLFEIRSSELAIQKSSTPDVLAFARRMIDDYSVQANEMQALAARKNITLPMALPSDQQAIINRLNGEEDAFFDKDYMNEQVFAHDKAIQLFEQAAEGVQDTDIKAFAGRYLPVLRQNKTYAAIVKRMADDL